MGCMGLRGTGAYPGFAMYRPKGAAEAWAAVVGLSALSVCRARALGARSASPSINVSYMGIWVKYY
jgi:hypothetical protein